MMINFLDAILPKDLNVGIRIFLHVMVVLHAVALLYWIIQLVKYYSTPAADRLRQQMEAKAKAAEIIRQHEELQRLKPKAQQPPILLTFYG